MPAPPQTRSKRKRRRKPAPLTEAQAERRGLTIFLKEIAEFRLALALYNEPMARDALIRELTEELAGEGIRVLTLDLREPSAERTLLARVESVVKSVPPDQRVAVMVVNLEGCVDYTPELSQPGGPGTSFLETANFHRELFPKVCPGPLVIWMTELLERAFVRHAPDLWHWRSHVFDFRTRRKPSETMPTMESHSALASDDDRLHPEERLRRLEEELAAYRKANARFDEMRVLNAIGIARMDAGDARLAQRDFEEALKIAHQIGHRSWEGAALGNLGLVYADLGDARKAIEFHKQALVIDRETGDRHGEGQDLGNLGLAYAALGDARKAIEFYEQQLKIVREIGDRRGEGNALGNLGVAYKNLGDARKAIEFYEQYRDIAREIGDRRGEGNALWNSALAFDILGERTEAIGRAEAALRIHEAIEDPNADKVRAALAEWRG
jgi:tetratricopeptide (TPR) repeat protein